MEKFIERIAEMLDTDRIIDQNTLLSDIEEWDSLSVISFLAMVDIKYQKVLSEDDVIKAKSIQDLYNLVAD